MLVDTLCKVRHPCMYIIVHTPELMLPAQLRLLGCRDTYTVTHIQWYLYTYSVKPITESYTNTTRVTPTQRHLYSDTYVVTHIQWHLYSDTYKATHTQWHVYSDTYTVTPMQWHLYSYTYTVTFMQWLLYSDTYAVTSIQCHCITVTQCQCHIYS